MRAKKSKTKNKNKKKHHQKKTPKNKKKKKLEILTWVSNSADTSKLKIWNVGVQFNKDTAFEEQLDT